MIFNLIWKASTSQVVLRLSMRKWLRNFIFNWMKNRNKWLLEGYKSRYIEFQKIFLYVIHCILNTANSISCGVTYTEYKIIIYSLIRMQLANYTSIKKSIFLEILLLAANIMNSIPQTCIVLCVVLYWKFHLCKNLWKWSRVQNMLMSSNY